MKLIHYHAYRSASTSPKSTDRPFSDSLRTGKFRSVQHRIGIRYKENIYRPKKYFIKRVHLAAYADHINLMVRTVRNTKNLKRNWRSCKRHWTHCPRRQNQIKTGNQLVMQKPNNKRCKQTLWNSSYTWACSLHTMLVLVNKAYFPLSEEIHRKAKFRIYNTTNSYIWRRNMDHDRKNNKSCQCFWKKGSRMDSRIRLWQQERRPVGKPRKRWIDQVRTDAREILKLDN